MSRSFEVYFENNDIVQTCDVLLAEKPGKAVMLALGNWQAAAPVEAQNGFVQSFHGIKASMENAVLAPYHDIWRAAVSVPRQHAGNLRGWALVLANQDMGQSSLALQTYTAGDIDMELTIGGATELYRYQDKFNAIPIKKIAGPRPVEINLELAKEGSLRHMIARIAIEGDGIYGS